MKRMMALLFATTVLTCGINSVGQAKESPPKIEKSFAMCSISAPLVYVDYMDNQLTCVAPVQKHNEVEMICEHYQTISLTAALSGIRLCRPIKYIGITQTLCAHDLIDDLPPPLAC